jgi:nucleoside-diphosphate-sugar epimerase
LNILLIGGKGFIGSRLISSLVSANNKVIVASRNPGPNQLKVVSGEALEIAPNEFDLVINAAGKYGVKQTEDEINLTFEANVGVCTSISRSVSLISKGVINLGSYFEVLPMESPNRNIYYTKSKVIGNDILQSACDSSKKYYSRIILFDNYNEDLSRGKILDKIIQGARTKELININNVESLLNLLSTNQISESITKIVESFKTSQVLVGRVDIKNQNTYKILDLIKLVESFSGRKLHFTNLDQKLDFEVQKLILEKKESPNSFNLIDEVPSYLEKMLRLSV